MALKKQSCFMTSNLKGKFVILKKHQGRLVDFEIEKLAIHKQFPFSYYTHKF